MQTARNRKSPSPVARPLPKQSSRNSGTKCFCGLRWQKYVSSSLVLAVLREPSALCSVSHDLRTGDCPPAAHMVITVHRGRASFI